MEVPFAALPGSLVGKLTPRLRIDRIASKEHGDVATLTRLAPPYAVDDEWRPPASEMHRSPEQRIALAWASPGDVGRIAICSLYDAPRQPTVVAELSSEHEVPIIISGLRREHPITLHDARMRKPQYHDTLFVSLLTPDTMFLTMAMSSYRYNEEVAVLPSPSGDYGHASDMTILHSANRYHPDGFVQSLGTAHQAHRALLDELEPLRDEQISSMSPVDRAKYEVWHNRATENYHGALEHILNRAVMYRGAQPI